MSSYHLLTEALALPHADDRAPLITIDLPDCHQGWRINGEPARKPSIARLLVLLYRAAHNGSWRVSREQIARYVHGSDSEGLPRETLRRWMHAIDRIAPNLIVRSALTNGDFSLNPKLLDMVQVRIAGQPAAEHDLALALESLAPANASHGTRQIPVDGRGLAVIARVEHLFSAGRIRDASRALQEILRPQILGMRLSDENRLVAVNAVHGFLTRLRQAELTEDWTGHRNALANLKAWCKVTPADPYRQVAAAYAQVAEATSLYFRTAEYVRPLVCLTRIDAGILASNFSLLSAFGEIRGLLKQRRAYLECESADSAHQLPLVFASAQATLREACADVDEALAATLMTRDHDRLLSLAALAVHLRVSRIELRQLLLQPADPEDNERLLETVDRANLLFSAAALSHCRILRLTYYFAMLRLGRVTANFRQIDCLRELIHPEFAATLPGSWLALARRAADELATLTFAGGVGPRRICFLLGEMAWHAAFAPDPDPAFVHAIAQQYQAVQKQHRTLVDRSYVSRLIDVAVAQTRGR